MPPPSVAVAVLGIAAASVCPIASAWTLSKDEVSATTALATLLYSAPVDASMQKCVEAAGEARLKKILLAKQRVADLPTKSSQQQELDRIAELQKGMMNRARADCMLIAASYLERINKSLATRPWAPDEVARTTADLSAAGLRDLSTALQYQDKSNAGASENRLGSSFYYSLESCYEPDQLFVPQENVEEVWNASCRLIKSIGLEAPKGKPDFQQAVSAAPAANAQHQITPPSTQGPGARTTLPDFPLASRWAGEAGTVVLKAYVLESGRVGEVQVEKSSGFRRLDESAVREVQTNWRFVPGKQDGVPTAMWHTFALIFRRTD